MRAWCIGCKKTIIVRPEAIDRCPACQRRYSLILPREENASSPGRQGEPFDWIRSAIGWSMFATLLVIVWLLLAGGPRRDDAQPGTLAMTAAVLTLTFLTFRLGLIRVVLALGGIVLLALWMWGH